MRIWLSLLLAAASLWCARAAFAHEAPEAGHAAPAFELPGSDGRTHRLADFRGKSWVVLAWYPKAFTGGCTRECQALRDSSAALQGFQVQVFGASVDTPEKNAEFARSLELDYPLLSDPSKEVAAAWGVLNPAGLASRWTFVIDPEGVVRAVETNVKPDTAGADLAALLERLGVPKR